MRIPEIIAHRGYSHAAPENTLSAVNLAWQVGADAVEIDIYLTSDNRVVLSHDGTMGRTTGVDMTIRESTLGELRALDIGKRKGDQWAGERIATLEEALSTIPEGKRMLVHVGPKGSEIIPHFLRALDASNCTDKQVAAVSFYEDHIRDIKMARPSVEAYWLWWTDRKPTEELVRTAKAVTADGLDTMICDAFNEEYVAKVRSAGLGVYVWTVDGDSEALRMAGLGVDGITTNRAPEIMALLKGKR